MRIYEILVIDSYDGEMLSRKLGKSLKEAEKIQKEMKELYNYTLTYTDIITYIKPIIKNKGE